MLRRVALAFCPQYRSGRQAYLTDAILAGIGGLVLWLLIDPLADAEWIPDEAIVWIGTLVYPLIINLILLFLTASSARRLHDIGHSGAWAFWMLCPGLNLFLFVYLLIRPGTCNPTGWRCLEDA